MVWLVVAAVRGGLHDAEPLASVLSGIVSVAAFIVTLGTELGAKAELRPPQTLAVPEWVVDRDEAAQVVAAVCGRGVGRHDRARERIAQHGVAPGQFAQLLALYEQDGLTQRELCRKVKIEQPTMAYTLKRMERDGLVYRSPDPHGGRQVLVLLTDAPANCASH